MAGINNFQKKLACVISLAFLVSVMILSGQQRWPRAVWLLAGNPVGSEGLCNVTFELENCSCLRTVESRLPPGCPGPFASSDGILEEMKLMYGESTCNDWATFRGPGQKVLSYSVFGNFKNDYFQGFERVVPQIIKAYPGWNLRFYFRLDTQNITIRNWLCDLACRYPHLDLCHVERLPVLGNISRSIGRVWRFASMGDSLVDYFSIRDADSLIIQREIDAVQDWLKSGNCFHAMRDHPLHGVKMLAGMWGGCNTWRPDMLNVTRRLLNGALEPQKYTQDDQNAMQKILWNVASLNITVHDSYFCKAFGNAKPFPTQRVNLTYIGAKNYIYEPEFDFPINKECPVVCRPPDHQDWKYC
ncbi:uncharacterized protein [Palaemon carinicauda]|uniref:uncharacterized protein isoform X2 n=1 Tax=Palaemon carinicauda TaxID=392227 RepID=UPI0035B5FC27